MKTNFILLVIVLVSVDSFAAGSTVNNSTIVNKATIMRSRNLAIGSAEANQGSISLNNANMRNSTIINKVKITNSNNVAIGFGGKAQANQGAVKASKSLSGVKIVNEANISNSTNVAVEVGGIGRLFGTNKSNQGSIILE
jgi:hypothetical protein